MSSLGESEEWPCPPCCLYALPFADCHQPSSTNTQGDTSVNTSSASESCLPLRSATQGLACTLLNTRSIVSKRLDIHDTTIISTQNVSIFSQSISFIFFRHCCICSQTTKSVAYYTVAICNSLAYLYNIPISLSEGEEW